MTKFNPEKLFITWQPGVQKQNPIIPRRYTLTHSDVTAELFLSIGPHYAYEAIGPLRDEVLAEWHYLPGQFYLYVYLYVGGASDSLDPARRYQIFRRELPLALKAITYGDSRLWAAHPELKFAPIWVYFQAEAPFFNRLEFWGRINNYL